MTEVLPDIQPDIQDVYRLSPLQEGMLFESLYAPEGDAYVVQTAWLLEGDLDPVALRRAWEHLTERHAVLRTSFHWDGMEHPHQVVHRSLELPWSAEDWRGVPAGERERRLEERHEADRRAGFDLDRVERAVLPRVLTALLLAEPWMGLPGWRAGKALGEWLFSEQPLLPLLARGATRTYMD